MLSSHPCTGTLPDEAEKALERLADALQDGRLKTRLMAEMRKIILELYRPD